MGKPGKHSSSQKQPTWKPPKERVLDQSKQKEILISHSLKKKSIKTIYTPSKLSESSPFTPPDITLLPASQLVRHEEFLHRGIKQVSFFKHKTLSWNDAPMVGTKDKNGKIIILDGSTRLKRVEIITEYIEKHHQEHSPPVFPVQIIDYFHGDLVLDIWEDHHHPDNKLTKQEVLAMVKNGKFVEAKQTRFGIRIEHNVFSIAETQGEIFIPIENLIGFTPNPEDNILMWLFA